MSCSKPLPPFTYDLLCYLNRDQLERFSIVCRPLKNFINRYFHSKPCRIFHHLYIRGGSYALRHKLAHWHPNREDYTAQQFQAGQRCNSSESIDYWNGHVFTYFSFAEMRPYLGPSVRINRTAIFVTRNFIYSPEHVAEMESIAYLWHDGEIRIEHENGCKRRIGAAQFDLVLDSPIILQCRELRMINAHFPFKDYKVLYAVKVIKISYYVADEIELWQQFLEHPGNKPVVVFDYLRLKTVDNLIDLLWKAFSSAVLPNAYKIVFLQYEPLTEFRETNDISREKFEMKEGLPVEYRSKPIDIGYTLERSSI